MAGHRSAHGKDRVTKAALGGTASVGVAKAAPAVVAAPKLAATEAAKPAVQPAAKVQPAILNQVAKPAAAKPIDLPAKLATPVASKPQPKVQAQPAVKAAPVAAKPQAKIETQPKVETKPKVEAKPAPKPAPVAAKPAPKIENRPAAPVAAKPVEVAAAAAPLIAQATKIEAKTAQIIINKIEQGAKTMNETINKTVDQTREATQQATDQFRNVVGETNERSKVVMEKGARFVEEMADLTRGNVEALVASSKTAAKYVETLNQGAADYNRRSFEQASAALKSFAEVKSPTDFFRLQSDYARSAFDQMVAESARVSETMVKMNGDVAEPITSRYSAAAERMKAIAA